jgi:amino acid transporter
METARSEPLHRGLSALGNGVITFAGVGVFGGLFSLYAFSMGVAGPAEFWGWPLVALSVGMIVLVFAELASAYPFVGSMYQWPTILAGRRIGWSVGWLYLGAVITLMTAYYASLPTVVRPLFGWSDTFATNRDIILFAMVFAVVWNLVSIGALGRLAKYGMVIEVAVVTLILLLVFVIGPHHFGALTDTSTVVTDAKGNGSVQNVSSFGDWLPLMLGGGIFNAFWVLYTFENAGTLGEETRDASRNAPRAVLGAFGFCVAVGFVFLISLSTSVPDIHASMVAGTPAQDAITNHLPDWVLKTFLLVVTEGLLLATATMFAGAVRHIFGMARDRQIPFSGQLSRTLKDGSPWVATLVLGGLSVIPVFIFTTNTASIVGGATAAMYLAYFAVIMIALVARLRGWSNRDGVFSLGRWGMPVNILAALGAGASLLDLMWHRAATNPTYDEIVGKTTDSFFRHIPMAWYVVGVPVLVGVVYYALQHRRIHTAETAFEGRVATTGGVLGAEPLGHVLGEPVTDPLPGKMVNR